MPPARTSLEMDKFPSVARFYEGLMIQLEKGAFQRLEGGLSQGLRVWVQSLSDFFGGFWGLRSEPSVQMFAAGQCQLCIFCKVQCQQSMCAKTAVYFYVDKLEASSQHQMPASHKPPAPKAQTSNPQGTLHSAIATSADEIFIWGGIHSAMPFQTLQAHGLPFRARSLGFTHGLGHLQVGSYRFWSLFQGLYTL